MESEQDPATQDQPAGEPEKKSDSETGDSSPGKSDEAQEEVAEVDDDIEEIALPPEPPKRQGSFTISVAPKEEPLPLIAPTSVLFPSQVPVRPDGVLSVVEEETAEKGESSPSSSTSSSAVVEAPPPLPPLAPPRQKKVVRIDSVPQELGPPQATAPSSGWPCFCPGERM